MHGAYGQCLHLCADSAEAAQRHKTEISRQRLQRGLADFSDSGGDFQDSAEHARKEPVFGSYHAKGFTEQGKKHNVGAKSCYVSDTVINTGIYKFGIYRSFGCLILLSGGAFSTLPVSGRKQKTGNERGAVQDSQSRDEKLWILKIFVNKKIHHENRTQIIDKTDQVFCFCFGDSVLFSQIAHHLGSHGTAEKEACQNRVAAINRGAPDQMKERVNSFQQERDGIRSYHQIGQNHKREKDRHQVLIPEQKSVSRTGQGLFREKQKKKEHKEQKQGKEKAFHDKIRGAFEIYICGLYPQDVL